MQGIRQPKLDNKGTTVQPATPLQDNVGKKNTRDEIHTGQQPALEPIAELERLREVLIKARNAAEEAAVPSHASWQ